jgi:hypothetical protein
MPRITSFAESGGASRLPIFAPWEINDDSGTKIPQDARSDNFISWANKMIMDQLGLNEAAAIVLTGEIIKKNNLDSCYSFTSAFDIPFDKWDKSPSVTHMAALNLLNDLSRKELKVAQGAKARVVAPDGAFGSEAPALISALVSAQIHGRKAEDLQGVPGLEHHLAESKRIRKQRQLNRLKEEQKFKLTQILTGACPKFSFISKLDQAEAAEEKHPKFDLRKDCPLWAEISGERKEGDSEPQLGLATLLGVIDHFLLGQLIRQEIQIVHLLNTTYQVKFIYRKYGRDIGLAWFQELLDELHKRSQTDSGMLPLKDYLLTFDTVVHIEVMETLRNRFPKKSQEKGGISMKEVENRLKGLESRKPKAPPPPPPNNQGRGNGLKRVRSPTRSPPRRRTPPRKGDPPFRGGGGSGIKRKPSPPEANTPELNKAFSLAVEKKQCGHHQKGICSFGADCQKRHLCVICGSKAHGAIRCPELKKDKGRKLLA